MTSHLDVDSRLSRLERENKTLRRALAVLGLTIGAVSVMGASAPKKVLDEVRTRRLVVVDKDGRERIVGSESASGVTLMLSSSDATHVGGLMAANNGVLGLAVASNKPGGYGRVTVGINDRGDAGIRLFSGDGTPRIVLEESGRASFAAFSTRDRTENVSIGFGDDGSKLK